MDFFEKAHVVKRESSRKEHKSEGAVKKQLKQLLHGYKQRDTKLIQSCDDAFDPNKLLDESSSVSGFSDLNLTNSSNEADTSRGTVDSDTEDEKTSDVDEPSQYDSLSSNNDNNLSENVNLSKESISEYDDNIQTLSDNITAQVILDSNSDTSQILSDGSIDETTTENDLSESEFDADGVLANKILEKLEVKGVVKKKRGQKRKYDSKTLSTLDCELVDKHKYRGQLQTEDDNETSSQYSEEQSNTEEEAISSITSDTNTSDFISIAPKDMPVQSLCEILGDYKYSTVRNLPEVQSLQSTNNFGTFAIENIEVDDIQLQDDDEEPERYNEKTIESNDVTSLTDLDTSEVPISESTNVYDDTQQSDDTSEKEMSEESLNFVNPIKVYYGRSSCILVLKHPAELYIHGKVTLRGLGGAMEIFGHRLGADRCDVYAPNYNYAFCLKTVEEETDSGGTLFGNLTSAGLSVADAEEIVVDLGEYDGIVSLRKLNNHKMSLVDSMITTDLFSKINKNVENCFKKASQMLGCSLYLTRPYKAFEEFSCSNRVVGLGSGT